MNIRVKHDKKHIIEARGKDYRELNACIKSAAAGAKSSVDIMNVYGQRYIGAGLESPVKLNLYGTPGNNLGAFLHGAGINVYGNAQDCTGNTMDSGKIIIHGSAGDITGFASRGGNIFVRDGVGYRAGVHMKQYGKNIPKLVIGNSSQDFLGEYMAGGVILILGLDLEEGGVHQSRYIGNGMHGGVIYIRGRVNEHQLNRDVRLCNIDESDTVIISSLVGAYCNYFGGDPKKILESDFIKLKPATSQPYGVLYTS